VYTPGLLSASVYIQFASSTDRAALARLVIGNMLIGTIYAPPTALQIAAPNPPPAPSPPRLDQLDLELLNVIGENGEYGLPIWSLLNWVAGDQNPRDRHEVRSLRLELWHRLKRLMRARLVFRFGRKCVTLVKLPPIDRRRGRRARRPSVRRAAILNAGSTNCPPNTPVAKARPQSIQCEPVHVKALPKQPLPQVEKSKSAPTREEISGSASALARLPRKPKRRWTGFIGHQRTYRDQSAFLPTGEPAFIYGVLRGQAIVTLDRGRLLGGYFGGGGLMRWGVVPANQVKLVLNESARILGLRKRGVKERLSTTKRASCRRNGRMPARRGRRGRPRKMPV